MEIENKQPFEKKKSAKAGIIILTVFVVILSLGLSGLIFMYFHQKEAMVEMEAVLTAEKDSLTNELQDLIFGYDTLKTSNDTLNIKLEEEQNKIQKLLQIQASNAQKILLYKKELSTLRKVMKSYIVQIDSLNTKNKMLIARNAEFQIRLEVAQKTNKELSAIKDELSFKVKKASVIVAKNIHAAPLNNRGKEKDRIDKIEKIRVCFTLRENPIVNAGKKDVYMRIIRPDSLVLALTPENIFSFQEKQMIYSAMRTIEYLNKDVDMCIYFNQNEHFITGKYTIELFLENNQIGTTSFTLRESGWF